MAEFELWAHPAEPHRAAESVMASLERRSANLLVLRWVIRGDIDALAVPPPAPPRRTDGLWETTCFELFIRPIEGSGYRELNFSPSGQWAAYDFCGYRAGMVQAALPAAPQIRIEAGARELAAEVRVSLDLHDGPYAFGLCAIVDERGLGRSFWATRHGGAAPDFHHPACFADELPPAPRP